MHRCQFFGILLLKSMTIFSLKAFMHYVILSLHIALNIRL